MFRNRDITVISKSGALEMVFEHKLGLKREQNGCMTS